MSSSPSFASNVETASRELKITADYLYLPVVSGARARQVKFAVDGKEVLSIPAEIADGKPGWYAAIPVAQFKGQSVRLTISDLPGGSMFFDHLSQGDERVKVDGVAPYNEALRPLFHWTASRGWINDPNAPMFYDGQWHLFVQLDPAGYFDHTKWWGHAVSKDLLHWTELDHALAPGAEGMIYSGSGVTDWNNTSGLGKDGKPPMVVFYTGAGNPFTQCMAYSVDGGKTLIKYEKNPVVPNLRTDNRDPRVIWHEPTKQWVMVVWVRRENKDGKPGEHDTIQFLTSPNLKDWTPTSENEGFFECPDLIAFPNDKWVLTAASGNYQIGTFDGKAFKPETKHLESSRTGVFYAAQTFTDVPKADGRVLQIGWMRDSISPGMPFNQCLSVVHELGLIDTPDGPRMTRMPHRELEKLRGSSRSFGGKEMAKGDYFLGDIEGEGVEVRIDVPVAKGGRLELNVRGISCIYEEAKGELNVGGHRTPVPLRDGHLKVVLLIDRTVTEVFAADGLVYFGLAMRPEVSRKTLYFQTNEPVTFKTLDVHTLGSMWSNAK